MGCALGSEAPARATCDQLGTAVDIVGQLRRYPRSPAYSMPQLQLIESNWLTMGAKEHRCWLQGHSAEKFARAGPNYLHAEAKQDKGCESNENVRTYGSKQSWNSIRIRKANVDH